MSRKSRVARLSILSNTILIILKFIVGFMTGAVSIISEAIHSLMDLIAAVIAYLSVKFADRPPDETHPFGHEKMENISGVIETILILVASVLIIKEAIHKLIIQSSVKDIHLGVAVMLISALVNFFVSRKLYLVAREEGSVAIEADALHLKADVYTSAGVAAGLLLIWVTGIRFLDPVVAIGIALFIVKEAVELMIGAVGPLLDMKLSDDDISRIREVISRYGGQLLDCHELRTRRAGNIKHIDLHVTTPHGMTISEFHTICDRVETDIENVLKNTKVLIHGEPCARNCGDCTFAPHSGHCQHR